MICIAICEDDSYQRENLVCYASKFKENYPDIVVHAFESGEDFLQFYEKGNHIDILLLDIEMKKINGVEVASYVRERDRNAIIMFISSFTRYISKAFTLNAFQFIIKPVNESIFIAEFERALQEYHNRRSQYTIKYNNQIMFLEIRDIVYIEGYRRHLYVHTPDKSYETLGKLIDEEAKLKPFGFVRIHQGFLVNMAYIHAVEKLTVSLETGQQLQLSERKRKEVLNVFTRYMMGRSL